MEWLILLITGTIAGFLGGFLGIGGGVVLMPALKFFIGLPTPIAIGTVACAVFTTTLSGGVRHYRLGNVHFKKLLPLISAGIISSTIFSLCFLKIVTKEAWLDLGIGSVFLLVSSYMIYDVFYPRISANHGIAVHTKMKMILLGVISGIFPGLFGIGTGAILVPSFLYLLKTPVKIAIGSSLVCFSANALISSLMKFYQGYVNLELLLPIILGCFAGSQIGAIISNKTAARILKFLFALFFLWSASRFIDLGSKNL